MSYQSILTERAKLLNTPINDKLIKKAISRKYNIK
jgi:hypothetical protein